MKLKAFWSLLFLQGSGKGVPKKEEGIHKVPWKPCGRARESEQGADRGAQVPKRAVLSKGWLIDFQRRVSLSMFSLILPSSTGNASVMSLSLWCRKRPPLRTCFLSPPLLLPMLQSSLTTWMKNNNTTNPRQTVVVFFLYLAYTTKLSIALITKTHAHNTYLLLPILYIVIRFLKHAGRGGLIRLYKRWILISNVLNKQMKSLTQEIQKQKDSEIFERLCTIETTTTWRVRG